MKGSKDILASVAKTTQMGQIGLRSMLGSTLQANLRSALETQLKEYDRIEREAQSIATSRGWELDGIDPAIKGMVGMMVRTRLTFGDTNSKAAAMLIQGNTRGIIKGLKNLHRFPPSDERVTILSQKLLDCEKSSIRQLQEFL